MTRETVPVLTRIIILLLFPLTVIPLLTLMFFVSKSLVKLYFERRNKILGYKFKTKFVVTLVVLTLIPATFLFIISSGIITNYIERWFTPQIREPLDDSIEIAKALYDIEREKTLDYALALSKGKLIAGDYRVNYLRTVPKDATETLQAAFDGKADVEVISGKDGDTVRAAVPNLREGKQQGIIVVEYLIPHKITTNVINIKNAHESYLTLDSLKTPLKINYLLILGFLTMIVVFITLWVALRIARGITDPIQSLAQATELVAAGDLHVQVDIHREDEIGLLVNSFNNMVKELKDGKESLQSAYLELESILDNIDSGVILLDISGTVRMINGAACSILNLSSETVSKKHYRELLQNIKSTELHSLIQGIEGTEFRPVKKELKALVGDRRVILRVFITSLRDSEKYIGILVVFDDLTEIIEAEKVLTWQEIARRVAHEIKNPLTPIKLSTERLIKKWEQKDTDFDQVFERSAKTIIQEVDSLKRLVDEFSKIGKMPEIHKIPTNIPSILDEAINLYKGYKNIEFLTSIPDSPPLVDLDGEQFKRVIINIFDNAMQAMSKSGTIHITTEFDVHANKVYISIADTGQGIKDEDKEKLFQPYFSTRQNGTGLGLAIANRIITEHRGYMRIKDNKPHGTIVTIEIPIKES
jgi:two-component system nitrogen regulation sensor histidine kinase NtrY